MPRRVIRGRPLATARPSITTVTGSKLAGDSFMARPESLGLADRPECRRRSPAGLPPRCRSGRLRTAPPATISSQWRHNGLAVDLQDLFRFLARGVARTDRGATSRVRGPAYPTPE